MELSKSERYTEILNLSLAKSLKFHRNLEILFPLHNSIDFLLKCHGNSIEVALKS